MYYILYKVYNEGIPKYGRGIDLTDTKNNLKHIALHMLGFIKCMLKYIIGLFKNMFPLEQNKIREEAQMHKEHIQFRVYFFNKKMTPHQARNHFLFL